MFRPPQVRSIENDPFMKLTSLFIAALLPWFISCKNEGKVEKGVTHRLAQERKENVSEVHYSLSFDIPSSMHDSIQAKNIISLTYKKSKTSFLLLDFNENKEKIKKLIVNNRPTAVVWQNGHIIIASENLDDGDNRIEIDFTAGDLSLNRNDEYLYTLFVPDRASTCFPVLDQPDIKATYTLQLGIPINWEAVSNTRAIRIDTLNNKKQYHFGKTRPISTYHFSFATGKFKNATDPDSGMMMYYRETDSIKVARNLKTIFELHRQSVAWMENYTHFPYPFDKFDFVLIPSFQYGGMEHPGNIFYRESSLLLESTASVNQTLSRASVIGHETAHMWFGNLVTMSWFNDVWLKEVFANLMAAKIMNPQFPEINHDLRFLLAHYPPAYDVDRSMGTHPIQQELDNLKDAGTLYGAIIYQKAPIMIRNLEDLVGPENFQRGVGDYMSVHAYGNATWDDLLTSIAKYSDTPLDRWNTSWIKSGGMPEIVYRSVGEDKIEIRVANEKDGVLWPQQFEYQFRNGDNSLIKNVPIQSEGPATVVVDKHLDTIIPNFRGQGYGYFKADTASSNRMLQMVRLEKDPLARAGIWMNIWEYTLHGDLNPKQTLQKLVEAIEQEKNSLLLNYLTTRLSILFWQFIELRDRQLVAGDLDKRLFSLMSNEGDPSIRRTLYDCYIEVATSQEGTANLKKFWSDEISLSLDLSEQDHIRLACELAVRNAEGYETILAKQLENTRNPDRRDQMKFLMDAVSNNAETRDSFFDRLKLAENRAHEPWVLEALGYLHHPLRSSQSIRYITPSLEMIEEIQQSGDIFFPKGWLGQTLAGHNTTEAASRVREFLRKNPDLSPSLRNKVLQSADMLFRAEQILGNTDHKSM